MTHPMKEQLNQLAQNLFDKLREEEDVILNLEGEETQFLRFNQSKVRQATTVEQWVLTLTYKCGEKTLSVSRQISTDFECNNQKCNEILAEARSEAPLLPNDPFAIPAKNYGSSLDVFTGHLPNIHNLLEANSLLLEGTDLAGIYASGPICRGIVNSKGLNHWYQTETFSFDYSIYHEDRAVKGVYAGKVWKGEEFTSQIKDKKAQLKLLKRDKIRVKPGKYRCYLAPSAVGDILGLMNWGGFSFGAFKRGGSPLGDLFEFKKELSPKFNLTEDFSLGFAPRFNPEGELSPEQIVIIKNGKPGELLTSSRTAKEYKIESNGGNEQEVSRSLSLSPGTLKEADILKRLDTGLYLSNVHYLNWSDRKGGRYTGMTRFACFWVENGEIKGPIEDMRFDETVYDSFGKNLEDFTETTEILPEVATYYSRHLGATQVPGLLVTEFEFTL